MASAPMTQGERLARIEALLERLIADMAEAKQDIKATRGEVNADKADLAALKNKGKGLLIGVGLAGGTLGAAMMKLAERFFH